MYKTLTNYYCGCCLKTYDLETTKYTGLDWCDVHQVCINCYNHSKKKCIFGLCKNFVERVN